MGEVGVGSRAREAAEASHGRPLENHLDARLFAHGADDAVALRTLGGAELSYAALRAQAVRMAGALQALGVAPGDRVAVQTEKSSTSLVLYLATVLCGGVYLPLNPAYTVAELAYFLADAEPKVVVVDPAKSKAIRAIAGGARIETLDADGSGTLADRAALAAPAEPEPRGPDDLAAILYTSGTTGRSKGAMLTHANLASNAEVLVEAWRMSAADHLLHALPMYHTHGLFTACNTVLAAGAGMTFLPRFDVDAVLAALPRATLMMGVPTFYTRLLDQPEVTREATRHMRLFVSGSAPLLAETHRAFAARTGHAILERYGMTETSMNCSNPYDGERRAGTVGFPLPGVSLRIADSETGAAIARDEIGMIELRGPNVFAGYWRNPEKTAESFRDGYFVTGDLGAIDAGGYVRIVGRGKDLIITGGFNVYPKEVELEIDAIAGIVESAVIGCPHRDLGEAVTAVVVREAGTAIDEPVLLAALVGTLARYKQPKRVVFVDALPRNAMGKVQKNVLRETFKDLYARA